jgi:hypothetical protein
VAFDPCFHQACGTVANLNLKGLAEHKDAVHAIATFAQTMSAVNGTDKGSPSSMKTFHWTGGQLVR